jgi:hypothetical protein
MELVFKRGFRFPVCMVHSLSKIKVKRFSSERREPQGDYPEGRYSEIHRVTTQKAGILNFAARLPRRPVS